MRRSLPLGLHVPGSSLLHRAPAGAKLVGLVVFGVVVVALRGPWWPVGALVLALIVAFAVGMRPGVLVRTLRPVVLILVVAAAFQWWARGWPLALEILATILAIIVGSAVMTATTPTDELLDAVVRGVRPLRRFGVNPEAFALSISLMVTSIPAIFGIVGEARDAAVARGLGRSPRATIAPAAVRVVAHAHALGDALHARGILDDPPTP